MQRREEDSRGCHNDDGSAVDDKLYQPRYCGVLLYNMLGLYPPEA